MFKIKSIVYLKIFLSAISLGSQNSKPLIKKSKAGVIFDKSAPENAKKMSAGKPQKKVIGPETTVAKLKTFPENHVVKRLRLQLVNCLGQQMLFSTKQVEHFAQRHILLVADSAFEGNKFDETVTVEEILRTLKETYLNGEIRDIHPTPKDSEWTNSEKAKKTRKRTLIQNGKEYILMTLPIDTSMAKEAFITFYPSPIPLTAKELETTTLGDLAGMPAVQAASILQNVLGQALEENSVRIVFNSSQAALKYLTGEDSNGIPNPTHISLKKLQNLLKETLQAPFFSEGEVYLNFECPHALNPELGKRLCYFHFDDETLQEWVLFIRSRNTPTGTLLHFERFIFNVASPLMQKQREQIELQHISTMKQVEGVGLLYHSLKDAFYNEHLSFTFKSLQQTYNSLFFPDAQYDSPSRFPNMTLSQWAKTLLSVFKDHSAQEISITYPGLSLLNFDNRWGKLLLRTTNVDGQEYHFVTQKKENTGNEKLLIFAPSLNSEKQLLALTHMPLSALRNLHREKLIWIFESLFSINEPKTQSLNFNKKKLISFFITNIYQTDKRGRPVYYAFDENDTPFSMTQSLNSMFTLGQRFQFPESLYGLNCPRAHKNVNYVCRVTFDESQNKTFLLVTKFNPQTPDFEMFSSLISYAHSVSLWENRAQPIGQLRQHTPPTQLASLFNCLIQEKGQRLGLDQSFKASRQIVYRQVYQQDVPEEISEEPPSEGPWPVFPLDFSLEDLALAISETREKGISIPLGHTVRGIHCTKKPGTTDLGHCWAHPYKNQWFLLMTNPKSKIPNAENILKFYPIDAPKNIDN